MKPRRLRSDGAGERRGWRHGAAASWKAKATAVLDDIADPDEREIIEGDIATLP